MDQLPPCEICSRPIDPATSEVVPCSDCPKLFHSGCAGFSNLSAEQICFLQWFCDSCQEEEVVTMRGAKRAPECDLPTELWEKIFRQLNFRTLKRVRETCHRWKDIVDGSVVFMERFRLMFPADIMLDRDFDPGRLLPASTVVIQKARIVTVDPWWATFGEKMTYFRMEGCIVSLAELVKMLRQTPNLKRLWLKHVYCPENSSVSVEANFQLNHLEYLGLVDMYPLVRDLVCRLCPRIKEFTCSEHGFVNAQPLADEIVDFFGHWQSSLHSIAITPSESSIGALKNLKELRLTTVSFSCEFVQFAHVIPLFQHLHQLKSVVLSEIQLTNEELCNIGRILPELSDLTVHIKQQDDASLTFLNTMQKLEKVVMRKRKTDPDQSLLPMDFQGCRSPRLREIELDQLLPSELDDFHDYLCSAPNLHTVSIKGLQLASWSDLFETLPLTRLKHLSLASIFLSSDHEFDSLVEYYENLRVLNLNYVEMPAETLKALFRLCTNLEEVTLADLANLHDNVVLVLCQKLKHLKKLTIAKCPVKDISVAYIVRHCRALENLTLECCHRLTEEAREEIKWGRLDDHFEATVSFKNCNVLL